MCGRYVVDFTLKEIVDTFNCVAALAEDQWSKSWNLAPGQSSAIILAHPKKGQIQLGKALWGIDTKTHKIINLRSETITQKPFFAEKLVSSAALIPASGYYEWKNSPPQETIFSNKELPEMENSKFKDSIKIPYYISPNNSQPLAFAAIYTWQKSLSSKWTLHHTILTTEAKGAAATVHNRMPLLVPQYLWDKWLSRKSENAQQVEKILQEIRKNQQQSLKIVEVSQSVGNIRNNNKNLASPLF